MKLINRISKYKWIKSVKRENSALLESILRIGANMKNDELEFDSRMATLVLEGQVFVNQDDYKKLEIEFLSKCQKDINFLGNYLRQIENDCKDFKNFSLKLSKENFSKLDKIKLKEKYNLYINKALKIASHLWPILIPEEWLVKEIKNELVKIINPKKDFVSFQATYNRVVAPKKSSAVQERKLKIIKLACEIKKNKLAKNQYKEKLHKIYKNYGWAEDHYLNLNYPHLNDFESELKTEIEKPSESNISNAKHGYKLNKRMKTLTQYSSIMPYLRFLRLEIIVQTAFILRDMFFTIEKHLGFNPSRLFCFEISQFLIDVKKIKSGAINRRMRGISLVILDNKFYELDSKEVEILKGKLKNHERVKNKFTGEVANLGYAKGRVKIITSAKQFNKFNLGDILVTHMTMPEYVPIMKIAKAIVTDEGGISCHAAIVSREINKPCIVGTKIATQILKDGDLVEVDANKATITILQSP